MPSVDIVTVTPQILESFYGARPPKTLRAIAGVQGERVLGLCGYYLDGDRLWLFSDIHPDGMQYKKTIVRIMKLVLAMAIRTGIPIQAVPDPEFPNSCRLLERLGFQSISQGVYLWRP